MQHAHRDWSSAEEFLAYVGELFPFHPEWPNPGPVSVSSAMPDGDAPLHVASAWGDAKAVALLLSAGAAVDRPGDMGVTALGTAASNGHVLVAELLLRNGADAHLKSEFDASPYQTAMREGSPELQSVFAPYAGA
jgi:ankyrin repeat protein